MPVERREFGDVAKPVGDGRSTTSDPAAQRTTIHRMAKPMATRMPSSDNRSDAERPAGTTKDQPTKKMRLDPDEQQVPPPTGGGDVAAPLPVSGCWFVHGAETSYYYDEDCECHVLEVWPVGVEEETDAESKGTRARAVSTSWPNSSSRS